MDGSIKPGHDELGVEEMDFPFGRWLAVFFISIFVAIDAGSALANAPSRKCNTEKEAIETGHEILTYVYPDFHPDRERLRPIAVDLDRDAWKVTYLPPKDASPGQLGGYPTVIFGKKTCEVLGIFWEE